MLADEKLTDWKIMGPMGVLLGLVLVFLQREVWSYFKKKAENADKQSEEFLKKLQEQGQTFAKELKEQRETFLEAMRAVNSSNNPPNDPKPRITRKQRR